MVHLLHSNVHRGLSSRADSPCPNRGWHTGICLQRLLAARVRLSRAVRAQTTSALRLRLESKGVGGLSQVPALGASHHMEHAGAPTQCDAQRKSDQGSRCVQRAAIARCGMRDSRAKLTSCYLPHPLRRVTLHGRMASRISPQAQRRGLDEHGRSELQRLIRLLPFDLHACQMEALEALADGRDLVASIGTEPAPAPAPARKRKRRRS